MYTAKINTVYKQLEYVGAKNIALVTHNLREVEVFEDGKKVIRRELRQREEILRNQLLSSGIRYVPLLEPEIMERRAEFRRKGNFDACVITGDPFYQLFRVAALVCDTKYRGPIFLEITEDEAIKPGSIVAAGNAATRHKQELLLGNLVYLSKTMRSPRELTFKLSLPVDVAISLTATKHSRAPIIQVFHETAIDLAEPPLRLNMQVSRIIRDSKMARSLKVLYDNKCQVCGSRIELSAGNYYSEVHHIRPLGGLHKGLDATQNMLVLCPNHHAAFDLGVTRFISSTAIEIMGVPFPLEEKHQLSAEMLDYHNRRLCRSERCRSSSPTAKEKRST